MSGTKLAPFNPTHIDACRIAIDMLQLTSDDIVYDLGKPTFLSSILSLFHSKSIFYVSDKKAVVMVDFYCKLWKCATLRKVQ